MKTTGLRIASILFVLFLLLFTLSMGVTEEKGELSVYTLHAPPTEGTNDYYVANREPLLANPLMKLPVGSVKAKGWLNHQLILMSEGMFGRLPELSKWCEKEGSAWMDPEGEGNFGWEELPYWLKGFGDLGYLLDNERIIEEAKTWIEAVLASQEEDGYFGPRLNKVRHDVWPNMIMLDVLKSYYEYSGDERILPFMERYFRWQLNLPRKLFLPGSWQKIRGGDNLHSIYWLYNRTGESWLLELATKNHECTADWTGGIASWHGVNITQCFREPAQYFQQSKAPIHLQAAERNYQTVMDIFGQVPGGMFGADENCRPGYTDPRQAAESCSMVEYMRSNEILIGITGNPLYADRCEEIAFNSLPAAMTPDLKALHYLTAPNMVQLDAENKSPGLQNGGCMLAYSPWQYRCCQHNVSQGWPYFTEHLWMATHGNGLAAVMYSPCEVKAKVGNGETVTITEETDYPFRDTILFKIFLSKKSTFPLMLRIPGWCLEGQITINDEAVPKRLEPSSFVVLKREWNDGDRVQLELPMEVRVKRWPKNHNAASVERGPLTYSLKIGERWAQAGGTEAWPVWEVYPTTDWNYGLVMEDERSQFSFTVYQKQEPLAVQPFTPENTPVQIKTTGRKIPNWKMAGGLVGRLQPSPVQSNEPKEEITLIPMGCARLRISMFPVIGDGPHAVQWVELPPPVDITVSHDGGSKDAIRDSIYPRGSDEDEVSHFTWLPHRGTEEWVTYRLEKPRRLSGALVYWYVGDEEKGCRLPESWKLLWKDGENWKEVENPSGYGVAADGFNRVLFRPVFTDKIRLQVKLQDSFSAGVYEWIVGD